MTKEQSRQKAAVRTLAAFLDVSAFCIEGEGRPLHRRPLHRRPLHLCAIVNHVTQAVRRAVGPLRDDRLGPEPIRVGARPARGPQSVWPAMIDCGLRGESSRTTVLILHGQPGSSAVWREVAQRLSLTRRVVVPDRPGWGASRVLARGLAANADWADHLLDRLGVADVVVVGHSWGGAAALTLALRHPARVRALVLVGSVGPAPSLSAVDHLLAAPFVGDLLVGASLHAASRLLVLPPLQRWFAPELARVRPTVARDILRGWRGHRARTSFLVEQRALVRELPALETHLERIAVPATVVVGERDRVVHPRVAELLVTRLPHAHLHRLAGLGHLLAAEAPVELAHIIGSAARAADEDKPRQA